MDAVLDVDEHVRRIIAIHFDPEAGTLYWLERARDLRIDARSQIRTLGDLQLLGPMAEDALRTRPILDFVPRGMAHELVGAIVTETGGTTGGPKRTVFSRAEFHAAFVEPFIRVADMTGFPRGQHWLWVGPSGPHVIGQAAGACATALGSPQPFAIDFDPRWFRKLPAGTLGRERYMEHLLAQAMDVIRCEPIGVIFTTPVMLERLASTMTDRQRRRIRGVHYGGMRVNAETLAKAQTEWFAGAVHLAGYGNSLFGVCMEFGGSPDRPLRYFPLGVRHAVHVADDGRVWMSRLDRTVLIANLPERDRAQPGDPPEFAARIGFNRGVQDPRPFEDARAQADVGIY